jgi:hypothetical protein
MLSFETIVLRTPEIIARGVAAQNPCGNRR